MNNQIDVEYMNTSQNKEIAQHIVSIIKGIRFGSIEIVVHEGRVVQIDKHEKFRLKTSATS